jgi:hypothetical protein
MDAVARPPTVWTGHTSEVPQSVEGPPALSIGFVQGGPDADPRWKDALLELGRRVIRARQDVETPLSVNVVYQVPGRFLSPDFIGVRTGRFSKQEVLLLVQVALPPVPSDDAMSDAIALLSEAVGVAEHFGRARGLVDGELIGLRELVERVEASDT